MINFINRNKKYIISLVLFILFLHFLSNRISKNNSTGMIGQVIVFFEAPIQSAFSHSKRSFFGGIDSYVFLFNLKEKIKELKHKNQLLEKDLTMMKVYKDENEILKNDLNYLNESDFKPLMVDVIGLGGTSYSKVVRINKGSRHGIKQNMGVYTPIGCIGKVVSVFFKASDVLLITDSNSSVDVRNARNRARAIMKGMGEDDRLRLDYVDKKYDFSIGDTIVTSGIVGIWPKDIIVGSVESIDKNADYLFQTVYIKPTEDFKHLDHLLIYLGLK
ncbi:MAG: rod shape-determining protein MreC [Pseudomonadota bacterium]